MTRPAPTHVANPQSAGAAELPPCLANPQLWDSTDNAEALAACRRQCPKRVTCAQEVLSNLQDIDGVVAGVALPPENEHGTSKSRRAAVQRLRTIAGQQQRAIPRPPDQPGTTPRPTYHAHHGSAGLPDAVSGDQPGAGRVVRPSAQQWGCPAAAGTASAEQHHVGLADAAAMTGLSKDYLKQLRRQRRGPKWWRTNSGVVRYWVVDVEKWMSRRQRNQAAAAGRRRRRPGTAPITAPLQPAPAGTFHHNLAIEAYIQEPRPVALRLPTGQLDIDGVARITGLAVSTLYYYRAQGRGPKSWIAEGVSIGRLRYWEADVRAWMEQEHAASSPAPTVSQPSSPIARAS